MTRVARRVLLIVLIFILLYAAVLAYIFSKPRSKNTTMRITKEALPLMQVIDASPAGASGVWKTYQRDDIVVYAREGPGDELEYAYQDDEGVVHSMRYSGDQLLEEKQYDDSYFSTRIE